MSIMQLIRAYLILTPMSYHYGGHYVAHRLKTDRAFLLRMRRMIGLSK